MSKEFEVILPKLGESIVNATVVQWFKKEGDKVKKDEPLLEVSTDKVNSEIPAPFSGVIKIIHAQVDQELNVGDLLAVIIQEEEVSIEEKKKYFSPALLRLAQENDVSFDELKKISGTGAEERVTKKDLENYISSKKEKPSIISKPMGEEIEHVKMSGMRKTIAENMVRSFYEAPHASLVCEVDVTDIMKITKKEKENFLKTYGVKLTITSFVARAITRALREYPLLNSSLEEDIIMIKRFVNLGIAVSVEQGVIVPVIQNCQKLSLHEIALSISEFSKKAREGSLSPKDVQKGTITMTNFGMTGIKMGIPIIRYPEVAIIGMGSAAKKVVALEDDVFGVRQTMHISLTFDHRIIDGMYGCGFLTALKKHLEEDLVID